MAKRSLGTLTVDLIVKMGGFEQGMGRASRETKKRMREIQGAVDDAAKRVRNFVLAGAAVVTTGAAITTSLVNNSRQAIDTQAKLARSLNTTVDSLTALQLRAGDSGIDKLDMSLNRMNRRLGAAEFGTGAALKTVEKLKLDLDAMRNMDVDEKIGYIGDRIDEMGVSSEEAARHLQQLGFEQAAAIELFRDGSDQVGRYRREVQDLGLSMSDLDAKKVEQMNDALGIFDDLQKSVSQQLTIGLAPTILAAAEAMEQAWIDHTRAAGDSAAVVEQVVDRLIVGGVNMASAFRSGGIAIKNMVDDIWAGFQSLPPWAQEFGVVGAIIGGKKGLATLMVASKALEDTKTTATWFKAMTEGDVGFFEWLTHGAEGARERLEELGIEIENTQYEGPSIVESLFGAPSEEETKAWADNIINAYRERLAEARSFEGFTPPELIPETPAGDTGGDDAAKLYDTQSKAMLRQIALYGEASMAAQLRYDSEFGAMAELSTEQQEILMVYAQQLDYLKELEEANQKAQEEAKKRAAVMDQFTTQAARNMQTTLADYLFDPFDEGVKGMLRSFGEMMRQMAAEVASAAILRTLFGGFAASSNPIVSSIGSSFAGLRDGGGYVPPGGWAIAGEIGPEIVRGPAMITSRSESSQQLGGAGATQIIVHAEDPGAEARIRSIVEASAPQFISAAVGQTVARLKRPRLA